MRNNEKYNIFSMYNADENQKGKVHYISFKYLCLCLYIIGFYCLLLCKSLGNCSFGIANISNVYERNLSEVEEYNYWPQRKSYLKYKKEDVNKIKSNLNKRKYNEQIIEKYENIINKNLCNIHMEYKNSSYKKNMDYKNMSKNLTEKELRDGLNSLEGCPSKEDLRIIWAHILGVVKGGLDDVLNMLKGSIQKYLDNDIYVGKYDRGKNIYLYERMWDECYSRFYETIVTEELKYSKKFFSLINGKNTLDDILNFIYSFLEYIEILKNELHGKYQKELSEKISKISNKKK
ncbi:exported protein (PHISTa) [Plasmodium reichenowi]|uniref:Exported protein (PHISTa) n=1 Tax=Plasmodium reichenowi TaxID=5854 RepID=A0A151L260_PLARE|nr:exported protein (PHISTa) [Plasmodium reichenowi]KYN93039.1 exported protein (PHISTa) [Plasmodium reichenowi]